VAWPISSLLLPMLASTPSSSAVSATRSMPKLDRGKSSPNGQRMMVIVQYPEALIACSTLTGTS
jgi:hypothetical protein